MYFIHLNIKIWCAGLFQGLLFVPIKHHENIWISIRFQPVKAIHRKFQPVNANSLTMESFPTILGLRNRGGGWTNNPSWNTRHTVYYVYFA